MSGLGLGRTNMSQSGPSMDGARVPATLPHAPKRTLQQQEEVDQRGKKIPTNSTDDFFMDIDQLMGLSSTEDPRLTSIPEEDATFAALSQGWEGLFHETPMAPIYTANGGTGLNYHGHVSAAMLDDRWSSFMHDYGVLNAPRIGPASYHRR